MELLRCNFLLIFNLIFFNGVNRGVRILVVNGWGMEGYLPVSVCNEERIEWG